MGMIADRKKGKRVSLAAVLLLCVALLLSGCGNQTSPEQPKEAKETTKTDEKATKNPKSEEREEEVTGNIPSELLPDEKADTGETKDTEKQNGDNMEIVAGDGTVYTYDHSSSEGGNGTSDSGNTENSGTDTSQDGVIQIRFSVDSSDADGSVSFTASMTLDAGATVYDALAASGLTYSGKGYISEIEGLGEKMFGSQSGWKYYVNGTAPGQSCTGYVLKNGDEVQWRYVRKA